MRLIIADNYLCFESLLEMILSDVNPSSHFTQTDLAELFGITIPKGEHTIIKNVHYSNNIEEYGTNVCVEDINNFFDINSIPLKLTFLSSNHLDEMTFGEQIAMKIESAYIVFAFSYGVLYNEPHNHCVGHVTLLEHIDAKADLIQVYDPGPRNPGSKIFNIDDMLYAMKRRGGVFFFTRKEIN